MTVLKNLYEAWDIICLSLNFFPLVVQNVKPTAYVRLDTHCLEYCWVRLGLPRVKVIVAGSFGKQERMRIRNRLVISSFPKFTGHPATPGTHCVLVKTINETERGKEAE